MNGKFCQFFIHCTKQTHFLLTVIGLLSCLFYNFLDNRLNIFIYSLLLTQINLLSSCARLTKNDSDCRYLNIFICGHFYQRKGPFFIIYNLYIGNQRQKIDRMDKQNIKEVVIVGGGIAGIAAAYELNKKKDISWVLLEASNKMGGRLQSVYVDGRRVDTGAYQLASYGQKKTQNNQLYKLIKQGFCKIKHRQGTGKVYYYDETGIIIPDQIVDKVEKVMQRLQDQSQALSQKQKNLSVLDCLKIFDQKGGFKNLSQRQKQVFNLEIHLMQQQQAGQVGDLSANFMFGDFDAEEDNLDDYPLPVETYHGLMQQFVKQIYHQNLHLNCKVVAIERVQNHYVTYYQKNSSQILSVKSKYVICAVSLSTLKKSVIKFKPALPKQYQHAIQGIGFGQMEKVFLAFEKPFWKKDTLGIKIASKQKRNFAYFTNLSGPKKGKQQQCSILCTFVSASQSIALLKCSKQKIVQDAMSALRKAFPTQDIKLTEWYVTNWQNEPYIQGAYSYLSPKCTYKQAMHMRKPIAGLWFVGQYLYLENMGCAHGAYHTGCTAAKQIIAALEK